MWDAHLVAILIVFSTFEKAIFPPFLAARLLSNFSSFFHRLHFRHSNYSLIKRFRESFFFCGKSIWLRHLSLL